MRASYRTHGTPLLRSLQELREKKVDPAAPEAQELIARENEFAVRYGLRNHTATMLEWNAPVAIKWLRMGGRAVSRFMSTQSAAPDEGLTAYLHAAHVASPWHRALEPIVEEAAMLVDKKAQPPGAPAQALIARLRQICTDHSPRRPLVHARWARIYSMYLFEESSMKTAKIFKHGNSQAVRLPKEFRFSGSQVQIRRSGAGVLLLPGKLTFEQIMAVVGQFKGTIKRQQPKDHRRQWQ